MLLLSRPVMVMACRCQHRVCVYVRSERRRESKESTKRRHTRPQGENERERERGENIMITSKTTLNPGPSFFLLNIMIMNYDSISYLIALSTYLLHTTLPGVIFFLFLLSFSNNKNEMITTITSSTLLKRYKEVNKKTTLAHQK